MCSLCCCCCRLDTYTHICMHGFVVGHRQTRKWLFGWLDGVFVVCLFAVGIIIEIWQWQLRVRLTLPPPQIAFDSILLAYFIYYSFRHPLLLFLFTIHRWQRCDRDDDGDDDEDEDGGDVVAVVVVIGRFVCVFFSFIVGWLFSCCCYSLSDGGVCWLCVWMYERESVAVELLFGFRSRGRSLVVFWATQCNFICTLKSILQLWSHSGFKVIFFFEIVL